MSDIGAESDITQASSSSTSSTDKNKPGEAFLLADIERSRDYRKEYYKYAIGVATSLLAFTLAFQPTLSAAPVSVWMEVVGWVGLGVTIAAGLRVHLLWSDFFISYRDHDNKGDRDEGKRLRRRYMGERKMLEWLLLLGLIIGVSGVVGFTGANLRNVAPKSAN